MAVLGIHPPVEMREWYVIKVILVKKENPCSSLESDRRGGEG